MSALFRFCAGHIWETWPWSKSLLTHPTDMGYLLQFKPLPEKVLQCPLSTVDIFLESFGNHYYCYRQSAVETSGKMTRKGSCKIFASNMDSCCAGKSRFSSGSRPNH